MRDEFLDVFLGVQIDFLDVGEVAAENRTARHQEGFRILAHAREIAVGHEISIAFAIAGLEPVLVERRDGQGVGQVHLIDEVAHLFDDGGHLLQAHFVDGGGTGSRAGMHADGGRSAAHQHIGMRILAAENRLQLHHLALPGERIEIVRHSHEVRLRRQGVAGMAPVGIGEDAELAGFDQFLDAILHVGEVAGGGSLVIRDGLRQCRGGFRIGFERGYHVHPVERVQVIEMHHMVVHELRGDHEIAYQLRIGGDGVVKGILDGAHRRDPVDQRAHAADALREGPGVARVAALQDDFDAAYHGAGTGGTGDHRAVEFRLDPQMAFDPRDRIDHDGLCAHGRFPAAGRLAATSSKRLCGSLSQLKWVRASSKVRRQSEQLVTKVPAPVSSISRNLFSMAR